MSETAGQPAATEPKAKPEDIQLPQNSFWPLVLALGLAFIIGGLAVNFSMIIMGIFVTLVAFVGWIALPGPSQDEH